MTRGSGVGPPHADSARSVDNCSANRIFFMYVAFIKLKSSLRHPDLSKPSDAELMQ